MHRGGRVDRRRITGCDNVCDVSVGHVIQASGHHECDRIGSWDDWWRLVLEWLARLRLDRRYESDRQYQRRRVLLHRGELAPRIVIVVTAGMQITAKPGVFTGNGATSLTG